MEAKIEKKRDGKRGRNKYAFEKGHAKSLQTPQNLQSSGKTIEFFNNILNRNNYSGALLHNPFHQTFIRNYNGTRQIFL